MFENMVKFLKKFNKKEKNTVNNSKDAAKERLHLVLMQDRANVSADFLELMKQEIIEVIKKYIEVDEGAIDVRLTNKENEDGTNGAPALYANIPILNIKNEARKVDMKDKTKTEQEDKKEEDKNKEEKQEVDKNSENNKENTEIKNKENKEVKESRQDKENKEEKEVKDKVEVSDKQHTKREENNINIENRNLKKRKMTKEHKIRIEQIKHEEHEKHLKQRRNENTKEIKTEE